MAAAGQSSKPERVATAASGSSKTGSSHSGSAAQRSRTLSLIEQLTSRLRVSDPPEQFQAMAAAALRKALRVAAVAWVPRHPREPVIVAGGVDGMSAETFRAILPDDRSQTARIVNQPAGPGETARKQFAIVAANTEDASGWFIALNTLDDRSFTPAEVELIRPVASLVGTHRTNARHYADLQEMLFGVIRALTSAIDAKDPYTSGHSERVARIAVRLAEELGVAARDRGDLYLMGLLHDVGKIGIEDDVLKKTGPLTPDEFRVIQSHVRIGVQILCDLKKLHHLLPGVAHHHESIDGTGYPSGLAGEKIPLAARILAVADAFDAMSSTRPYRRRLSPTQIDDVMRKGAGKQWDERVVSALFTCRPDLEHIRSKGLGESLNKVVNETLGRKSVDE